MQRSIVDAVAIHAERTPTRVAADTLRRSIDYSELAGRAGHLTGLLDRSPPGPVIIQLTDAVDLAVASVAALAGSRTFLVVERNISPHGLEALAEALGAPVLLRAAGEFETEATPSSLAIIDIADPRSAPLPRRVADGTPMAFALTSGSTGRPKIVRIFEEEVLLVLDGRFGEADLLPSDVPFFPLSPATFTVIGFLRGLTLGTTVVCTDPRAIPLSEIAEGLREQGVTFIRVAPSVLRRLVRSIPDGASLPAVRAVQCTGEALLWSDIESLRRVLPATAVVHNRLGMTETGELTVMPVRVSDAITSRGAVPVGRGLPGRRITIEDAEGRAVEQGIDGEVIIEGDLHRSADGMVRLPDGSMRFPTGDIGCIDSSGNLVLRGRSDRMLKVSGVRVEPAMVEEAVRGLLGVVDVAVIPISAGTEETRLAALVVIDPSASVTPTAVREAVRRTVSASAVPARLVLSTDPLPLLENGKLDLLSLAAQLDPSEGSTA
jgi:acyl-coenzyme A synthetase/AMP-(fatty) acid ligase